MRTLEVSGRTVEEAMEEACKQLGVRKNNIQVEVLHEPTQGLFKLLSSKPAKIKVTVDKEPEEYMVEFVEQMLVHIGLEGRVAVEEDGENNLLLRINGKDLGILIGKRGSTLNALQYLANIIYFRNFNQKKGRVLLDVENYRQKRASTLEQLAQNLAQKAERTGQEVVLEPMTPQERRIIHLALKDHGGVVTSSQGEEPNRKVIISPRQR